MGLLDFIIKVAVDANGVRKGTQDVEGQMTAMGKKVSDILASAFSASAIKNFVQGLSEAALHTEHIAEQLGVAAGFIEKLERISARKGLEPEGFEKILGKMSSSMHDALTDDKELEKLEKLGLTWADIAKEGANAGEAFEKIANHLKSIGHIDNETRAVFSGIFGKGSFRYVEAASELPGTEAKYTDAQRAGLAKFSMYQKRLEGGLKRIVGGEVGNIFSENIFSTLMRASPGGFSENLAEWITGVNKHKGPTSTGREDVRGGGFIPDSALPDRPDSEKAKKRAAAEAEARYYFQEHQQWLKDQQHKGKGPSILTDALASVGGFVGGAGMGGTSVLERSLTYQKRTASAVEGIHKQIKKGALV